MAHGNLGVYEDMTVDAFESGGPEKYQRNLQLKGAGKTVGILSVLIVLGPLLKRVHDLPAVQEKLKPIEEPVVKFFVDAGDTIKGIFTPKNNTEPVLPPAMAEMSDPGVDDEPSEE